MSFGDWIWKLLRLSPRRCSALSGHRLARFARWRNMAPPFESARNARRGFALRVHTKRKPRMRAVVVFCVDPSGFEPLTSSVQMRRSTN